MEFETVEGVGNALREINRHLSSTYKDYRVGVLMWVTEYDNEPVAVPSVEWFQFNSFPIALMSHEKYNKRAKIIDEDFPTTIAKKLLVQLEKC